MNKGVLQPPRPSYMLSHLWTVRVTLLHILVCTYMEASVWLAAIGNTATFFPNGYIGWGPQVWSMTPRYWYLYSQSISWWQNRTLVNILALIICEQSLVTQLPGYISYRCCSTLRPFHTSGRGSHSALCLWPPVREENTATAWEYSYLLCIRETLLPALHSLLMGGEAAMPPESLYLMPRRSMRSSRLFHRLKEPLKY